MEEAIKVADPARWGRWLLRRGQEEIDREGVTQPSGAAGAPSGPAGPAAAVSAHSETEAPKEVRERNPGCQEESPCARRLSCSCVVSPLTAGSISAGGGLMELLCKVDMCEVFSPPRVGPEAVKFGLEVGDAMDLTTGWDFTKAEDRRRAEAYVDEHEPLVLIGSPPCVAFSQLQSFVGDSPRKAKQLEEGIQHMQFMVKLYKKQVEGGRIFIHENPAHAKSSAHPA